MHVILLSGGSGKRLWPLSNDVRSKQFLKILDNGQGECESMVQRVYRQLQTVHNLESVTIAAGCSQLDQLQLQLGKSVNVVVEPERRDTFPAIALACAYLYSEKSLDPEENIIVLPVDLFVEQDYFDKLTEISAELDKCASDLVLLGAKPVLSSEKYGYILPCEDSAGKVECFKEKPCREEAIDLIAAGALWNCGVFDLKLKYIFTILEEKYGIKDYSFSYILQQFTKLTKTSFDYEVVEHAEKIRFVKYEGLWKDLGTWETLTEEMGAIQIGNVVRDNLCDNTHVINEQELPVMVMGIKNAVVAASPDGILVATKGESYKLKDLLKDMENRPMYEEKRWGSYKVIDRSIYDDGTEVLTKKLFLHVGQQISYQYHEHRREIWTVVKGEGMLIHEGQRRVLQAGAVVTISPGEKHGIKAQSDLEIIEVQLGQPLVESDIVRIKYDWS